MQEEELSGEKWKSRSWRNDVQRGRVIKTTTAKMPTVKCKKLHRPGVRIRVRTGWWNMTGASLILTSLAPSSETGEGFKQRSNRI